LSITQRARLYRWFVYHFAFENYFFRVRRRGQIILLVGWVLGCAFQCYLALPLSLVLVIASPFLLTACMLGIWAYVGYRLQRGIF